MSGRRLVAALVMMAAVAVMESVLAAEPTPTPAAAFRDAQRAEFAALPIATDPKTEPGENPIDAILSSWRGNRQIAPRPTSPDHALIRRIHLDSVGLPPSLDAVDAFVNDRAPDRVERVVTRLLDDRRGYAEHWMTFWSDLLRNDEQTNIDGLRKPITPWLYAALRDNMPYDRMAFELLNPGADGPDGYLKGVNWRGRVNLSQRPEVQAAQNVSQIFLATSIRCASCHDGFTTHWKLREAYGLAAFFSESRLEMARCDKPTGEFIPARFLFGGLGEVAPDADLPTRRAAVARMMTRPKNARFARVAVNRLWARLLGRGLAEPIDEIDDAVIDCPELLDWLAYDFMKHDYDLKRAIALIMTSEAYRKQAEPDREAAEEKADGHPIDIGPHPRRMTAEQFEDAVALLTGHWPKIEKRFSLDLDGDNVRAWRQKKPDALLTALGRPNREQVVSRRSDSPTVLQALEVTNGKVLADRLAAGAAALLASDWDQRAHLDQRIERLWRRAFSRTPSPAERALIASLFEGGGDDKDKEGLEDALWIIVNDPEFHIIQ